MNDTDQSKLIDNLSDLEQKSMDTLDKTVFSLSAIFVGAIFGFLNNLNDLLENWKLKSLVSLIFLLLIASILFNLRSQIIMAKSSRAIQHDVIKNEPIKVDINQVQKKIETCNKYYMRCFVTALICMAVFLMWIIWRKHG